MLERDTGARGNDPTHLPTGRNPLRGRVTMRTGNEQKRRSGSAIVPLPTGRCQTNCSSKKQYVSPFYLALIYAGLGENDRAMDWMEKAYADRSNGLVFLKVDPELDSLCSNPSFEELLVKMRLSDGL